MSPTSEDPVIRHALYDRTVAAANAALSRARPGGLVWIIGPSGVGKSELRFEIMQTIAGKPDQWGVGRLPALSVRAAMVDRSKFNPKDLALRLALGLRQPNLSWLSRRSHVASPDVAHIQAEASMASLHWTRFRASNSEHALRNEFEIHARARGLRWVFIEEIHSLLKLHVMQRAEDYMTSLMQLAEEAEITLILIGTHHAAPLWLTNEEVRNRSTWVWFKRYNEGESGDFRPFAALVKALGRRHQLSRQDLLTNHLDLLLLNSAGLFGTARNYLARADQVRMERGKDSIGLNELKAASRSKVERDNLWAVVRAFDELALPAPANSLSEVAQTVWGDRNGAKS